MRKRYIKSVAHWVIMTIVLLFPILMVGISSFAQKQQEIFVTETYEYQTNEVNSVDDLVVGNIYKFAVETYATGTIWTSDIYNLKVITEDTNFNIITELQSVSKILFGSTYIIISYNSNVEAMVMNKNNVGNYLSYSFNLVCTQETITHSASVIQYFSASDYLGEKTIDYTITDQTMRNDVNEWCSSFRNLPVNQWYGEMLDTIGLGITNSMMMNVIYTYPLYVLWVYIIDLLVDCLLVIINFGHNALKRLGGDNE